MVNFNTKMIAFKTIVEYEMVRFLRIWPQTLLPSVITMTLYFLIFGSFVGSRVGMVNDIPYMQFIMPGLIMMSMITSAYINVVSSFYGARAFHSIEELLIAPVPNWIILCGYTSGGIARSLIIGLLVMLVSLFFTHLQIAHLFLTMGFALLTAILFALLGFTNAMFARKFDDTTIIPTFILTPLTYLGGVFYALSQLPPFWQDISRFNPILYMINGFRYGILGTAEVNPGIAFFMLLLFVGLFFSLNLYLLHRGIGLKE